MSEGRYELVVVRGSGVGLRLAVRGGTLSVGRALDAALPLTDRRVSRRHLEVRAASRGVAIRVCDGAAKVLRNGEPTAECEAVPGDEIVVGDTVLAVVDARASGAPDDAGAAEGTDVRTLLTGVAAEVRGLAAVFALGEALAAVRSRDAIAEVVREWARSNVSAADAELAFGGDPDAGAAIQRAFTRPEELVLEPSERGCTAAVRACANPPCVLAFHFDVPPAQLPVFTRRSLVVAGGVCALAIGRLYAIRTIEEDRDALRSQALGRARGFLGASAAALRISKLLPRLAATESCVLLLGETGSGKTFVARLLHEASDRAQEPFRVINCAAIPENLLESELFGSERGAFTGAVTARAGAFEAAGAGTILLDEVAELPLASQAKLLGVLEERRFQRIGSNRDVSLRARVLAATNRDLGTMVEAGTFRRDLYYRLSVVTIPVPALRERAEDIAPLAQQVLGDLASTAGRRVRGFTPAALEAIHRYPWPGNVRELRNAVERAIVLGEGDLVDVADLPEIITAAGRTGTVDPAEPTLVRLPANLGWLEERAIEAALAATSGNRTRAAALLGIHRMTLVKKLRGEPSRG